jgi:hypothetical protein
MHDLTLRPSICDAPSVERARVVTGRGGSWRRYAVLVSVRKGLARLVAADGALIGEGRAYVHLREPDALRQSAQGTLSLDWWDDALSTSDARLELIDGPTLALRLESDRLSGCLVGRILRYQTDWPGQATADRPPASGST